jgi:hypothetical protein
MGQDELQPASRSVRLGGELAGDDDVEGHGMKARASDLEPEGVGRKAGAMDPDGGVGRKAGAADDDDVEGHRRMP